MREYGEHRGVKGRMWRGGENKAIGGKGRTQEKRSMSCEEEGKASRGKEESKTHKRSRC